MKSSMKKSQAIFVIVTIFMIGCTNKPPKDYSRTLHIDSIVDLTHTLTPDFPFIPVKKLTYPFELIPMATLNENGVEANSRASGNTY
jgi:hypothetical protein